MRNKSSKRYSYVNHDSRERKFIHKNFNKTDSYHTNFSGALFENAAFVGAKFKFCAFFGAVFDKCYIRGTLFRGCNLRNSVFKNSIISATVYDRCKFSGVRFESCKIINSTKLEEFLHTSSFVEVDFLSKYPSVKEFNPELIRLVESLRANDFIRRSSVLHRKKQQIDTVSVKVLVEKFEEDFLIENLGRLPVFVVNEFYSLSYIMHFLLKLQRCDINEVPGPAALGAPKLTNDCSSTD